ncbi:MAG: hypothetical protein RIR48_1957 [Bacteroidota bacterium]
MTSAQNHLLPLNGSKLWITIIFAAFMTSCAVPKKSTVDPNVQIIKAETGKKNPPSESNDKTGVPGSTIRKELKVDTIRWKDVSASNIPIKITSAHKKNDSTIEKNSGELVFKDEYHVTLLIPLDSDQGINISDNTFIQFYAGILLGLDALDKEGIKLKTKIIDTREGVVSFNDRVESILGSETDLILGPYERDDIKTLVEKCRIAKIPLVSPWQTSTKITTENPYYIQIKPNLKEHFKKLAERAVYDYKKGEVAIVVKNTRESLSWVDYYQQTAAINTGIENYFLPYYVDHDTLKKGKVVFKKLFSSGIKAVILPAYDYEDEGYIISALRRLSVEKGNRTLEIYGMPLIYESEKIDYEYYHSLNVNVVISEDGDQDAYEILKFKKDYLEKYGEIPGNEAIKAFDLISYLGRNLWKHGKTFQNYLWQEDEKYLLSRFNVVKTNADESNVSNDDDKFDYFENKHLNIIQFKNNRWQIRD